MTDQPLKIERLTRLKQTSKGEDNQEDTRLQARRKTKSRRRPKLKEEAKHKAKITGKEDQIKKRKARLEGRN